MEKRPSLFSFSGRTARLPYALIAIPILTLRELGAMASNYLPLVFQKLGADLSTIGMWMAGYGLIMLALLLPLMAVSYRRLHYLRLSGAFSLPYLSPLVFAAFSVARIYALHGDIQAFMPIVQMALFICHWYGLLLALILLIVPGRTARPETVAVF